MTGDLSQIMQSAKNAVGGFTDKAANSVTAETKSALGNLGSLVGESEQAINHLTINLAQSIGGLNEATGKLTTSVLETTSGAVSTITEATNRAANTVKITTEQATGALNDATNVAVHQLNDATSSMTQTAEQLSGAISHSVQGLVVTSTQLWMAEHPIVSWLIAHPLWTIALALLTLFLGWSLFGAIAQLAQQALLSILQAPLKLIQSLSKSAFQAIKRTDGLQSVKLDSQQNMQKRLSEILNRLEILRQEEEALMKEMHSILLPKL